jgi:hypothetical protein
MPSPQEVTQPFYAAPEYRRRQSRIQRQLWANLAPEERERRVNNLRKNARKRWHPDEVDTPDSPLITKATSIPLSPRIPDALTIHLTDTFTALWAQAPSRSATPHPSSDDRDQTTTPDAPVSTSFLSWAVDVGRLIDRLRRAATELADSRLDVADPTPLSDATLTVATAHSLRDQADELDKTVRTYLAQARTGHPLSTLLAAAANVDSQLDHFKAALNKFVAADTERRRVSREPEPRRSALPLSINGWMPVNALRTSLRARATALGKLQSSIATLRRNYYGRTVVDSFGPAIDALRQKLDETIKVYAEDEKRGDLAAPLRLILARVEGLGVVHASLRQTVYGDDTLDIEGLRAETAQAIGRVVNAIVAFDDDERVHEAVYRARLKAERENSQQVAQEVQIPDTSSCPDPDLQPPPQPDETVEPPTLTLQEIVRAAMAATATELAQELRDTVKPSQDTDTLRQRFEDVLQALRERGNGLEHRLGARLDAIDLRLTAIEAKSATTTSVPATAPARTADAEYRQALEQWRQESAWWRDETNHSLQVMVHNAMEAVEGRLAYVIRNHFAETDNQGPVVQAVSPTVSMTRQQLAKRIRKVRKSAAKHLKSALFFDTPD